MAPQCLPEVVPANARAIAPQDWPRTPKHSRHSHAPSCRLPNQQAGRMQLESAENGLQHSTSRALYYDPLRDLREAFFSQAPIPESCKNSDKKHCASHEPRGVPGQAAVTKNGKVVQQPEQDSCQDACRDCEE